MRYKCELCGLVYDEEAGYPVRNIAPGTAFADLPADFSCPSCGCEKDGFYTVNPGRNRPRLEDPAFWNHFKYSDGGSESQR